MSTVSYGDLKFEIFPGVYEPSDDSLLLAENLDVSEGEEILDIGTGCGFLAIVAANDGGVVVATDINPNAIECARFNARSQDLDGRIDFRLGDLFSPVSGEFDLIVFNPPYLPVSREESTGAPIEHSWNGGPNGRKVTDRFLTEASKFLKSEGRILLVQSSLSNVEKTVEKIQEGGFMVETKSRKFFFERIYLLRARRS